MPFKISAIKGNPIWDTFPVAKIINYPSEKGAFRPFAQVRACVSEKGLHLRMWAFETKKRPTSYMLAALKLSENSDKILFIVAYANSIVNVVMCENNCFTKIDVDVDAEFFEGEDLEGIYWGTCITIKKESIKELFDGLELSAGYSFKGNFFKICSDCDFEHAGSFSYIKRKPPVSLFDESHFDTFTIVKY